MEDGDRLGWALHTQGGQEVLLLSAEGQSIRFGEDDVRVMGLPAGGVGGMKLRGKDRLVYAGVVDPDGELATISVQGFAKRTALAEYSSQGRNGGGILAHKLVERTGKLGAGMMLPAHADADNVVLVSVKGVAKPFTVADIPRMGRAASGKQILTLAEKDTVTAAWRMVAGRKGPGDDGGSDEATAAAEAPAPTAPRRQAAKQAVPPEQVELLEEAVAAPSSRPLPSVPAKGLAAAPATAAPLPLKRVKGGTAAEPVPRQRSRQRSRQAKSAREDAAEKPAEKPADKPAGKPAEKPAEKPTDKAG